MITWKNMDTLATYQELQSAERINLAAAMSGEAGAERVKNYSVPMGEGLDFNYGARPVDNNILNLLAKLANEAQLTEKYAALYNGEVINTGENRRVLHHLTRGQLGEAVVADGVDKRAFYVGEQQKIAAFTQKVHNGEITNAAGEKFTTVVQIGIGGSDLGPRAIYLALENWAKANNTFKMKAEFISNVDPDDASGVLSKIDVARSIFVLVSKSGTTLETLTNESFVKDALAKAGLDVQINTTTGEIALNAGVLFGYDQADLSEEGKTLLQDFLDVYTGVVLGDEYTDFVSRIIVEGHTDPVGDYNYNQGLSLRRAENVMAFCQSAESGLDAAQLELLSGILEAVGYSCDRPVYDENGQVDNDASRRVSFRFVINIGN